MSSLQSARKQIPANGGYYITLDTVLPCVFSGTDSAPVLTTVATGSTIATGVVLRDMGKTVVSSGRVFRKIQVLANTSSILVGGTDGVQTGAKEAAAYNTGFIELPGTGGMSSGVLAGTAAGTVAKVARLG
jgi:hypothetical protein